MLSKQKIKYIQSLSIKKMRQKYGSFIIEGDKMARELLYDKSMEIEHIFALETWILEHKDMLNPYFNKTLTVTTQELKLISNLTTPNKVLIIAKIPPPQLDNEIIENNLSLYLDGIQDPGNMGTILRIADWFSIPYVLCSDSCVDIYGPKVIQSCMGAIYRVKTLEIDFKDIKNRFSTLPVLVTQLRGGDIFKTDLPKKALLVIGNEGNGVSAEIVAQADYAISIPGGGGAESLNAAIATGIICAVLKNI
jgi:RNA methyltransferase, TrmH family